MTHPLEDRHFDYLLGEIDEETRALVEREMAEDADLAAEIAMQRRILGAAAELPPIDPPADLQASILAAVDAELDREAAAKPAAEPSGGFLRWLESIAMLLQRPAYAGALGLVLIGFVGVGLWSTAQKDLEPRSTLFDGASPAPAASRAPTARVPALAPAAVEAPAREAASPAEIPAEIPTAAEEEAPKAVAAPTVVTPATDAPVGGAFAARKLAEAPDEDDDAVAASQPATPEVKLKTMRQRARRSKRKAKKRERSAAVGLLGSDSRGGPGMAGARRSAGKASASGSSTMALGGADGSELSLGSGSGGVALSGSGAGGRAGTEGTLSRGQAAAELDESLDDAQARGDGRTLAKKEKKKTSVRASRTRGSGDKRPSQKSAPSRTRAPASAPAPPPAPAPAKKPQARPDDREKSAERKADELAEAESEPAREEAPSAGDDDAGAKDGKAKAVDPRISGWLKELNLLWRSRRWKTLYERSVVLMREHASMARIPTVRLHRAEGAARIGRYDEARAGASRYTSHPRHGPRARSIMKWVEARTRPPAAAEPADPPAGAAEEK